jgi:hypothetical protein
LKLVDYAGAIRTESYDVAGTDHGIRLWERAQRCRVGVDVSDEKNSHGDSCL